MTPDDLQDEGRIEIDPAPEQERAMAPFVKPSTKDTNPKDAIGSRKPPISTVPLTVLYEVGAAMLEGCKYRRHNYRVAGVRASVYFDAALRHLSAWWEGEDTDPDSGIHHVSKAIAGLFVLRDAMIQGKLDQDDRPPSSPPDWLKESQRLVDGVRERVPNPLPPYTIHGDRDVETPPSPQADLP